MQESEEYKAGSKSEKFGQWAKMRGGNFARAMFSGNPDDVKAAFLILHAMSNPLDLSGYKTKQRQSMTLMEIYGVM